MTSLPHLRDYIIAERLGSGTYATVYKAYKKIRERQVVAIKCISKSSLTKTAVDNLLTEISILKKLKHEYIVEMKDFLWDADYIYIIMEFCSGGDLSAYIRRYRRLPEVIVKRFLQQLSKAIQFIRSQNLSHMDLKPQNILLSSTSNPVVKLADFGFAQYILSEESRSSVRGSPLYMAPEILLNHKYDAGVDLWSIGVVLYECLFGQAPYSSKSFRELAEKIRISDDIRIPYGVDISNEGRDLILRLLKRNPSERISFDDYFDHPFLDLEHMPTEESFNKGISLVSNAVKKDGEKDIEQSIELYRDALQYLVPHVYAETDRRRKENLRLKVDEYMKRAEQLKTQLKPNHDLVNDNSSLIRLKEICSDDDKLLASIKILEYADELERRDKFDDAAEKYESGLNAMLSLINGEPTGERRKLLLKQIDNWMKRYGQIKSYLSVKNVEVKPTDVGSNSLFDRHQCVVQ